MSAPLLASERVLLLLTLVPYLREHGPTPIADLASTFEVEASLLRKLVSFLGTAGIPGETLAYQHDDLFDIDWDLFERDDIVSLTHTVAIDETPRFTGVETAALLAGLHALTPLLSEGDAALASALSTRLRDAMNVGELPAVTIERSSSDALLSELFAAIERGATVRFAYPDATGSSSSRTVYPESLFERQSAWYLEGHALERRATRTYRVSRITDLEMIDAPAPERPLTEDPRPHDVLEAIVPTRLLGAIRGFAPEVVKDAELPAGFARVRIDAWHPGAAVRLVQHGPGSIEVVSPEAARAAVRAWATQALGSDGHDG